jgi:hypothetical protein
MVLPNKKHFTRQEFLFVTATVGDFQKKTVHVTHKPLNVLLQRVSSIRMTTLAEFSNK